MIGEDNGSIRSRRVCVPFVMLKKAAAANRSVTGKISRGIIPGGEVDSPAALRFA